MTTTIVFAGTNDNYLYSSHATSYSSALNGANLQTGNASSSTLLVGQSGDLGQVVKTFDATWSASWYNYGKRNTTRAYQGDPFVDGVGPNYGKIGFNDTAIRNDLSGAVIEKVELRMSNEHSWFSSGIIARFGTHNNSLEPTGSASTSGQWNRHSWENINKGWTYWFTLSNAIGNEFRDGTTRGITTGRHNAGNRNDYGYWRGWNASASLRPQIRFTYMAPGAGGYEIWLSYLQFGYSAASTRTPVAGYFRFKSAGTQASGVERGLSVQRYDWGTSVGTGNWRAREDLFLTDHQNWVSLLQNAHTGSNKVLRGGIEQRAELDGSPTNYRYVLNTSTHRNGVTPSQTELHTLQSADTTGTANDPAMFFAETTKHRLDRTMPGQVQLSNGHHAYLTHTTNAPNSGTLAVHYHNGTSATQITSWSIPAGYRGLNTHVLLRDDNDNLYVLHRSNVESTTTVGSHAYNSLVGVALVRSPNTYAWTAQDPRSATLPQYWGDINNVSAAWFPRGTHGTIAALVSHTSGRNADTETAFVLINCDRLRTGSGSFFRNTYDATAFVISRPNLVDHHNYTNETGTLADVTRVSNDRGYVVSAVRSHVLGDNDQLGIGRFILSDDGSAVTSVARTEDSDGFGVKDADAKARCIPISSTNFVKVSADHRASRGIVVRMFHNSGTSSTFDLVQSVALGAENISTMPDASVLATSSAWDAIYSPLEHRVWVYYFDRDNPRRLMRTFVDLNTGNAGGLQVQVATNIGASGSTNLGLRLHRGSTVGLQQLVSVANVTSGGSHSLITFTDNITMEPEQPTLTPKSNFDSSASTPFSWTFNHANPAGSQGAFQLQIDNITTDTNVWDTGKVASSNTTYTLPASSIPNGESYRWRVRTWDDGDTIGPWSSYGTFQTSNTGIIDIIDPAIDNDPSIITADYWISWDLTGSTQSHYRVWLYRTDTETLVSDTGWVASGLQAHHVQDMESGIEYRVELRSRNASNIETNTDTRLITPEYAAPEVPILEIQPDHTNGRNIVDIHNPEPQGDRPHPNQNDLYRREAGNGDPFELVARLEPNEIYYDYGVRAGVRYEYIVRAGVFHEDD